MKNKERKFQQIECVEKKTFVLWQDNAWNS